MRPITMRALGCLLLLTGTPAVLGGLSGCKNAASASTRMTTGVGGGKGTPQQLRRFEGARSENEVPEQYRELARRANEKARAGQAPTVKP